MLLLHSGLYEPYVPVHAQSSDLATADWSPLKQCESEEQSVSASSSAAAIQEALVMQGDGTRLKVFSALMRDRQHEGQHV